MRIAFFGGSFDPPHAGHLAIARAAQQALHLDTVLFAPVALQPLKPGGSSAGFEDRAAMTRLAIAGQPHLELSLIDAPLSGSIAPNYTVDTLLRLRQSLAPADELYLLLGLDSFASLPQWHRSAEIPFLASLIVASRPQDIPSANSPTAQNTPIHPINPLDREALGASLPAGIALHPTPGDPARYRLTNSAGNSAALHLLPDLDYEISATGLRQAIHARTPQTAADIPAPVLAYIREHRLYR